MTRSFKVVLQVDGQAWTWVRTFAPDHSPSEVTVDEFLPLLEPCIGKELGECSAEARAYILSRAVDESTDLTSTVTSVEEI